MKLKSRISVELGSNTSAENVSFDKRKITSIVTMMDNQT